MTGDDMKAWRATMGMSRPAAAKALGISPKTIENYERGHRVEDGRPVVIPRSIALACAAVYHRLAPGGEPAG